MAKMARYKVKPIKMYSILPSINRLNGFKILCLNKWEIISGIVLCVRGIDTEGTWCCREGEGFKAEGTWFNPE